MKGLHRMKVLRIDTQRNKTISENQRFRRLRRTRIGQLVYELYSLTPAYVPQNVTSAGKPATKTAGKPGEIAIVEGKV
jgi:hypothetical protein